MTTTRIYQLDTINQEDINATNVFPAEDNVGVDTVQITLAQLAQYLFNGASVTDGNNPLSGYSLVIGNGSYALGNNSTAIGPNNDASNDGDPSNYCSAIGYQNHTWGNWGASAFGYRNNANYSQSSAFGHKNNATDRHASAFGDNNTASGQSSTAVGYNNTASNYGSTAVGYHNTVSSSYSTGVGYDNTVSGYYAQAFGYRNSVGGEFGGTGDYCTAIGVNNTVFGNNYYGSHNGGNSITAGYNNFVAGFSCSAFGVNNNVNTMGPVVQGSAIGYQNYASGWWGASAFGYKNTASESRSMAFGHKNTANGEASVAVGNYNTASGYGSTACGYNNTASNGYSNAFGHNCTASNDYALVMGENSTASGYSSIAVGYNCNSESSHSMTFGTNCSSFAQRASAIGYQAVARITNTVNIGGGIIIRADNNDEFNASDSFIHYSGVTNVVMTKSVDLTKVTHSIIEATPDGNGSGYQVGDTITVSGGDTNAVLTVASEGSGIPTSYTITNAGTGYSDASGVTTTPLSSGGSGATVSIGVAYLTEIDIPSYCRFYVDEVGLLVNDVITDLSIQPTVSFGWVENEAGLLAATQTTNLTVAGKRQKYTSVLTSEGKSTLTFSVTSKATATTMTGRAYFKGMLVENTPTP